MRAVPSLGMEIVGSKSIEFDGIKIQSRSISDPPLSDIDFKIKIAWVWTTLKMRCVFLVVVVLIPLHAEFGQNDYREEAPHFIVALP